MTQSATKPLSIVFDEAGLIVDKSDGAFETFQQLYRAYHQPVRSLIFRFGIEQDLDDVVQEVFLKVWRHLDQFEKKSSIKTWITRIAIHVATDQLKRARKRAWPLERFRSKDVDLKTPEKQLATSQLVNLALKQLPDDFRAILILYTLEGYTLTEISEALTIPQGTVKSRLFRARQIMMKTLSESGVKL